MGDSAPLLLPHCSSSSKASNGAANNPSTSSTAYVGGNCLPQILQAVYVSLAWAFDAQQTFISVFTDAEPAWHCTGSGDAAASCSSAASRPCGLPPGTWAWDLPANALVVSEWSLQCSNPAVVGLPASAYFAGCLAGGFLLATAADSVLGRKNMLFTSCLVMSLSAALTAVSPNVWAYSALRFFCGCGRATVGTTALVLSTELVSVKWRERISIVGFFCFTLGFLSLPMIAYINRGSSWKALYLWTSVPSACYSVLIYFLIKESPRWLSVRGRGGEGTNSSCSKLVGIGDLDVFSAIRILWERRWAFRRLIVAMIAGFGIGMVYYGMPLNVGNLGLTNVYLSVTFNALAELPSSLIIFFLIGRLNRRRSVLVLATASGVLSLLCAFVSARAWRVGAEVLSFFAACTAFNVLLIYSVELFPTCVRNSAISMVRQAVVLGGAFAPMLVVGGRRGRSFLSFGVFGLVTGCCGMVTACLPETRGRNICDTMEEEEEEVDGLVH